MNTNPSEKLRLNKETLCKISQFQAENLAGRGSVAACTGGGIVSIMVTACNCPRDWENMPVNIPPKPVEKPCCNCCPPGMCTCH